MALRGKSRLLAVLAMVVLPASGGWGKAVPVGGVAKSNTSGISAISCSSPGNCGAVGTYYVGHASYTFVISQVRGTWGKPIVIPGTARTSRPVSSPGGIACRSAGGCVVVGSYTDSAGQTQAFIAGQVRGIWRKIIWVPGLARLNQGHNAGLGDLSCPSAGTCTAAGSYTDAKGTGRPFTVSQVRGVWRRAMPVPHLTGPPGLPKGTVPGFGPISCASAGNCAAAVGYPAGAGTGGVYVDDEVHGTWGTPMPVPGLAALNTGLEDTISAISCPSPGNCGAGGSYAEANGSRDSFVVSESRGRWRTAIKVTTKIRGFNGPDGDWITTISCPSAGNCTAGGVDNVEQGALSSSVFLVSQVHGTWGKAVPVPGTPRLNQGDNAWLNQISCSSAGNCGAGGWYSAAYDFGIVYTQPFVVNQVHGTWAKAIEVPGIKTLPLRDGQIAATSAISCTAPDRCSAAGYYYTPSTGNHAFVDSQR